MSKGAGWWIIGTTLLLVGSLVTMADSGPSEEPAAKAKKVRAKAAEQQVAEAPPQAITPQAVAPEAPAKSAWRWGGDIRIREELFDHIPIKADPPGVTRGGKNDFFRFRTRLWGEADLMENVTFRARAVNEFRLWNKPDPASPVQRSNYDFPEEIVLDNLSLQLRNLAKDRLDITLGRQDLIYGTGFVVLEGTPKDGSRTIYFNAAKAVWRQDEKTTIDLFGVWNPSIDQLAIHSSDRDLTGFTSANDDMSEKGAGLYLKNKSYERFPMDAYLIYKREGSWNQAAKRDAEGKYVAPAYAWQTLNTDRGVVENPAFNVGTLGVRLLPQLSECLKANIELAYQVGERGDVDQRGFGTDSFLLYAIRPLEEWSVEARAGFYYLSGDDPKTKDDEGWNPLWARYPQYSELYVYAWDAEAAGRWSNLMMPNVGLSLKPVAWMKVSLFGGYMVAPEEDGPGGGDERGWLGVAKSEFTIREKLLGKKDKLTGHLWFEVLEPGDYYKVNDTAWLARWQVLYEF